MLGEFYQFCQNPLGINLYQKALMTLITITVKQVGLIKINYVKKGK